jgi:hypothetical protein
MKKHSRNIMMSTKTTQRFSGIKERSSRNTEETSGPSTVFKKPRDQMIFIDFKLMKLILELMLMIIANILLTSKLSSMEIMTEVLKT